VRRSRVVRASTAVAAQGVSSVANLFVAVLVARTLGVDGLGQFSAAIVVMLFLVSMQTVWVGDSYTVLDRSDPNLIGGVRGSQLVHVVFAALVSAPLVHWMFAVSWAAAACFTVLVMMWQMEEFGRRVLMAHRRFSAQGMSDGVYLLTTVGLLVASQQVLGQSLALTFLCMAMGATAAFLFNQAIVGPDQRMRVRGISTTSLVAVSAFGWWRAAQAGIGYGVQVVARWAVVGLISLEALSQLEAGRLVAAPLFVVVAAAGNVLLPVFTSMRSRPWSEFARLFYVSSALLALCVLAYGLFAVVLARPMTRLIAGPSFAGDREVVAAWVGLAAVLAFTAPTYAASVAVLSSRAIFVNRTWTSLVSLALALVPLSQGIALGLPLSMAVGLALSGTLLAIKVRKVCLHNVPPDGW
jgi:O-antigen/teichoic acid export membrane protein